MWRLLSEVLDYGLNGLGSSFGWDQSVMFLNETVTLSLSLSLPRSVGEHQLTLRQLG